MRRFAKGRARHVPGQMNGYEKAYAEELDRQVKAGLIQWWDFEPARLKLAKLTTYTPDFLVMNNDDSMTFVEIKGHWEDDARVKIKVAAEQFYMFHFIALQPLPKKRGGGWKREEF